MAKHKKVVLLDELKDRRPEEYVFDKVLDGLADDREQEKKRALNDLYHFGHDILEYNDENPTLKYGGWQEQPHREICEFVTNRWPVDRREYWPDERTPKIITDYKKRLLKLLVLPRGTFKSTTTTVSETLRYVSEDPNRRVLIVSETFENSKTYLNEIKQQVERNEKYISLFGDVRGEEWRDDRVTFKRTARLKESTITCAGVGVARVGQHYERIIIDDPHSEKNTTTRDQIEKVINSFRLYFSILDPGGELWVVGTRWDDNDLIGHILRDPALREQFDIMIRQCYNFQTDDKPFFPTRFTKEKLDSIRVLQGSYVYNAQYMNDPIDVEDAMFRKKDMRYWDEGTDALPPNLFRFTLVDPAISEQLGADYSAVVTVGMAKDHRIYVLRAERGRWKPEKLIDKIFEAAKIDKPRRVGIETVGFQQILLTNIRERQKKDNFYFATTPLKPGKRSKGSRIGVYGLQPRFAAGDMFIRKSMIELEDELLRFPKGAHDDLADALAYCLDVAQFPTTDFNQREKSSYFTPSNSVTGY